MIDIIILFLKDYRLIKSNKLELTETRVYILCGKDQDPGAVPELTEILKEKDYIYIKLDDPSDKEECLRKVKTQLEQEIEKIDTLFFVGRENKDCLHYVRSSLKDYNSKITDNNLKRLLDIKGSHPHQTAEHIGRGIKKATQDEKTGNEETKTSYKKGSTKTEEEKEKDKDIHEINKDITIEIRKAKRTLSQAMTKRIQFHLRVLLQSEFEYKEVIDLMTLVAKLPPKDKWEEKEGTPWSLKAEREKLLESWQSQQGNKSLKKVPSGDETSKNKLNKITIENYEKLKAELIYYYNLTIFLYSEDHWG